MYIYYDNSNEVAMISEGKIKAPNFKYISKTLTKDEADKFEQNWKAKIKNRKIIFNKPPHIKKEENEQQKKDTVAQVKELKEQIQDMPAKKAIELLIDLIKT